ncbi:DUF4282 domain-containing protein [Actinomadura kijaniata]|uniref:DUF4282 domain-containing protein n=1 Tax=Actinomadura kijaniata TaxID=46161 RepID=UPI003F1CDC7F
MTNPSEHGQSHQPPSPGQPPGQAYGPPPQPHPGHVPGPRQSGPGQSHHSGPQPVVPPGYQGDPRQSGPQQIPPQQGGPHYQQQARQSGPHPQYGGQEWAPAERPGRTDKGLLGALLDTSFDHLVTPKLVRYWYVVALLLVSLQCLVFLGFGLWIATWDDFWAWGVIMIIASPLVWLFEALLVRIVMEAVVVRFKGVEHLRVIRDKI